MELNVSKMGYDARSLLLIYEISYILYLIIVLYFYRLYFIVILSCFNVKRSF